MINNSAVIKRNGSQTLTTFVIVISVARRSVECSRWMAVVVLVCSGYPLEVRICVKCNLDVHTIPCKLGI